MVDAHIHLADPALSAGLPDYIEEARAVGVRGWLSSSTTFADWEITHALARRDASIMPAFGIHPWFATEDSLTAPFPDTITDALAIGEIGLDAHCPVPLATQRPLFRRQLELARDLGKAVVLHTRAPWPIFFEELARSPVRGVLHSFSGSGEIMLRLLAMGMYFSFGTNLLRRVGKKMRETIRMVPEERLLIETDAPAMPPPGMGGCNRPVVLAQVAEALAQLRGDPIVRIREMTAANLMTLLEG